MPGELRTALPSDKERKDVGRALRDKIKRGGLGRWRPKEDRADPVDLIEEAHAGHLECLVPVRVGRMVPSPYAFLRGAASVMAEDFAGIPRTGIEPVICGDAHLGNFEADHQRSSGPPSPVDCPPSMEFSLEKMQRN
jgi:hypothetical protein